MSTKQRPRWVVAADLRDRLAVGEEREVPIEGARGRARVVGPPVRSRVVVVGDVLVSPEAPPEIPAAALHATGDEERRQAQQARTILEARVIVSAVELERQVLGDVGCGSLDDPLPLRQRQLCCTNVLAATPRDRRRTVLPLDQTDEEEC